MKITVQTNKNIIFFGTLLSLINNEKDFHPLGKKIVEEFKDIKGIEAFKEFEKSIKEKKIPSHPWQYKFLSINLNNDLTPMSLSPMDGFGPKRGKGYIEDIYPIVNRINKESNFEERYKERILPDYEVIVEDIQRRLDKEKPEDILEKFWGKEPGIKLLFIPNPLRVGGGSSASREERFYSITGTVWSEDKIIFHPSHMVSNLLHEYSHLFFNRALYKDRELVEKNNELCDLLFEGIGKDVDSEMFKNYGSPKIYFEETFIRAVQVFLTGKFFEKVTKKDMTDKSLESLKRLKNEGFIYIENFYNRLETSKRPIFTYIEVLESIGKEDCLIKVKDNVESGKK